MSSFRLNYLALRVTQRIFKLIGLAPYSILVESSSPEDLIITFSYSRTGCVYNLILIIFITLTLTKLVPEMDHFNHPNYGPVVKTIDTTLNVLGNILAIITILTFCINQHNIVNIGNQLSEFNRKFRRPNPEKPKINLKNFDYFVTVFLYGLICVGILVVSTLVFESIYYTFCNLSAIICSCFCLQYSLIIKILKAMLKSVNDALQKIDKSPIPPPTLPLYPGDQRLTTQNLTAIRNGRAVIGRLSQRIADFHAFPILLIIFYASCGFVDTIYFFITNFIIEGSIFFNLASFNGVLWILMILYPLVLMCENVRIFEGEMERTADIIYDIRSTSGLSRDLTHELSDFAVEVLHRKVVFSAHGFFPLDCTLLYSIFGTIGTYLIILLQYKPADVSSQ